MPMTVQEYEIAQLYSTAEESLNETGGGEGIEIVKNEPFNNLPLFNGKYCQGQYTFKKYHAESKVPKLIKLIAPKGSLVVYEEAWSSYPFCRTVITNPGFMKDNFTVIIESLHLEDNGNQQNVFNLTGEKLEKREVIIIDIAANNKISAHDYVEAFDPCKFHSNKTGRGPLTNNWIKTMKPVMCCYKLVTAEFKWFGLQTRVETYIMKAEQRLFTNFHRKVFCWMDNWYGMTIDDIRKLEAEINDKLRNAMKTGQVRGMRTEEE